MKERRHSSLVTDFSVGFVLFVATIAVIAALFVVGGPDFGQAAEYSLQMPSAAGLKVGSSVELRGFEAGLVSSIDLPPQDAAADRNVPAGVQLTLTVNRKYRHHIRQDSFAWVQTRGLLGDAVVAIGGGTLSKPRLEPLERIPFKVRPLLDEIAGAEISANTAGMLGEIMELLNALNEGRGTLGQLLKNDSLYKSLEDFTGALARAGERIEGLGKEVEETLAEIRLQGGTLGKLIRDPELYDEATGVFRRVRSLLGTDAAPGVLATLLEDDGAARDLAGILAALRSSSEKMDSVLSLLTEGRGSLGMALHDPSLAAGLRDVLVGVREADTLLNIVRNAERIGREPYLKGLDHSEAQARETRRVRALAAAERAPRNEDSAPAEGQLVPAVGRESTSVLPSTAGRE